MINIRKSLEVEPIKKETGEFVLYSGNSLFIKTEDWEHNIHAFTVPSRLSKKIREMKKWPNPGDKISIYYELPDRLIGLKMRPF